jgi:proliferating cell nuclear antigen
MDNSHVALISLDLSLKEFESYRCDQYIILDIDVNNLSKVMKLADPSDFITLSADKDPSTLNIVFENLET